MRKGIGPRGLGAPKSPAKMMKSPGKMMKSPAKMEGGPGKGKKTSDRQKHAEGQIANKYNQELYRKEIAIRRRTYDEMGIGQGYKGSKGSPEYKLKAGIAEGKVQNRMKGNKGPKEIRARRDAELKASRDAYNAMPSTQSRKKKK